MASRTCQRNPDHARRALGRKLTTISTAVLLVVWPGLSMANNDLKNALDGMFMSNSTSPQAFHTQSRGGFAMGSVVARTPIMPIRLVAFDPPRVSGGCGGIDMYGGSFSFINKEALIAVFRQVVANAVSALFWYAIKQISEPLSSVMDKFQSLIQALNLGAKNTCALANQIIKPFAPSAVVTEAQNEKGIIDSVTGWKKDLSDAWDKMFETGDIKPKAMVGGVDKGESASQNYGNTTWKALVRSNVASGFRMSSAQAALNAGASDAFRTYGSSRGGDLFTMEMIQSILGTVITKNMSSGAPAAGNVANAQITNTADAGTPVSNAVSLGGATQDPANPSSSDTSNRKAQSDAVPYYPTIFSVKDFVEGPQPNEQITILGCQNPYAANNENGCNTIVSKQLTREQWPGIRGMIYKEIFGTVDGVALTDSGMIRKVTKCGLLTDGVTNDNPCGFTPQQVSIINTSGVPILTLLHKAQGQEALAVAIGEQLKDAVVLSYTHRLMQAVVQVATSSFSGVQGVAISPMTQDTINSIRTEYTMTSAQKNTEMHQTQLAMSSIDSAIKNLPSAVLFR